MYCTSELVGRNVYLDSKSVKHIPEGKNRKRYTALYKMFQITIHISEIKTYNTLLRLVLSPMKVILVFNTIKQLYYLKNYFFRAAGTKGLYRHRTHSDTYMCMLCLTKLH